MMTLPFLKSFLGTTTQPPFGKSITSQWPEIWNSPLSLEENHFYTINVLTGRVLCRTHLWLLLVLIRISTRQPRPHCRRQALLMRMQGSIQMQHCRWSLMLRIGIRTQLTRIPCVRVRSRSHPLRLRWFAQGLCQIYTRIKLWNLSMTMCHCWKH